MPDETWTIGRLLTWTTDYLKQQGSGSPRLDAEVLLARARRCERIQLYTAFGEEAPEELRTQFRELVRLRAQGKPVAYLVGQREFFSLPFEVNEAVLIPRPETELLVLEVLDRAAAYAESLPPDEKHAGPAWRVLDVGCGSGAIAVCVAKHLPRCQVVAVDVSPQALEITRRNAEKHQVAERIECLESDLFASIPSQPLFDCIVSNPPYVSEEEMQQLSRDVKDFEPHLALRGGGDDGSQMSHRVIEAAGAFLKPGGWLLLETSPMLAPKLLTALQSHRGYHQASLRKDLAGHARVLAAQAVGRL